MGFSPEAEPGQCFLDLGNLGLVSGDGLAVLAKPVLQLPGRFQEFSDLRGLRRSWIRRHAVGLHEFQNRFTAGGIRTR